MGGPLQKIFQGRGDKEGQGHRLKRALPVSLLAAACVGLLADFPAKWPIPWFSVSAAAVAISSVLHFLGRRKDFSVEFLFSLAVLYAGAIDVLKLPLLKAGYFPMIVSMTAFYSTRTIVTLALLIPLLRLKMFLSAGPLLEEAVFCLSLTATAFLSARISGKLRGEKERVEASLGNIKDSARSIALSTGADSLGMDSLSSDEVASHYFAHMLKTDEEIVEMLRTIKQAVFADAVSLFIPRDDSFRLRCSTEGGGAIVITGKGLLLRCIKEKKSFSTGELDEKLTALGYIKNTAISSVVIIPIMEGPSVTAVLAADSSRFQAFNEMEKNTVKLFSSHIARTLERERVYLMIKRDMTSLKTMKDESSSLLSSLNTKIIVSKLCEVAEKIAPSLVFFVNAEKGHFELMHHNAGEMVRPGIPLDFNGTLVNMAIENKQPMYVSDFTKYRIPAMPFKTGETGSVLVLPLVYESDLIGLLVMISGQRDFIDILQVDILKVMCNQASTSITNAKLHAEIEKMATTDGLTGLNNHRRFQEKLSEEMKRMVRFSKPVSLFLTDIDYFKKVNDTYGHPAGDQVLRGVAATIRETIREIDIPARYGGEEFAVILPGTDAEGASHIAERLRTSLMEKTFNADGKTLKVTISIGIAVSPDDAKSKEELIEKADQALYHAKHNGRNRSVLWKDIK